MNHDRNLARPKTEAERVDRLAALHSKVQEATVLLGRHLGACPGSAPGEAAELARTCATVPAGAPVDVDRLEADVAGVQELLGEHRCVAESRRG